MEKRLRLINSNGSISLEVTDPDEVKRLLAKGWRVAEPKDALECRGRGSTKNHQPGSKVMLRSEFNALEQLDRAAFIEAGGTLVDDHS